MTNNDHAVNDSVLIGLFRSGDAAAAGALYERHFDMAVRLARRTGPHPADAEEIASESFARVLSAIRKGGGPDESFSLYLRSTVRNTSISALRHRQRMRTIDDIERVVVDHIPDHADDGHDIDTDLAEAFDRLPERYRNVLHARVLQGKTNRESATSLGIAPTAEAMLYMRARHALKKSYLDTDAGRLRTAIAAFRKRHAAQ